MSLWTLHSLWETALPCLTPLSSAKSWFQRLCVPLGALSQATKGDSGLSRKGKYGKHARLSQKPGKVKGPESKEITYWGSRAHLHGSLLCQHKADSAAAISISTGQRKALIFPPLFEAGCCYQNGLPTLPLLWVPGFWVKIGAGQKLARSKKWVAGSLASRVGLLGRGWPCCLLRLRWWGVARRNPQGLL